MKKDRLFPDSPFEKYRLIKKCPFCEFGYQPSRVVVIEEYDESSLVHVTCVKCKSAILHLMLATQAGVNTVGIITDLDAGEAAVAKNRPSISEDAILDFHLYLQAKDSRFEKHIIENFK